MIFDKKENFLCNGQGTHRSIAFPEFSVLLILAIFQLFIFQTNANRFRMLLL